MLILLFPQSWHTCLDSFKGVTVAGRESRTRRREGGSHHSRDFFFDLCIIMYYPTLLSQNRQKDASAKHKFSFNYL